MRNIDEIFQDRQRRFSPVGRLLAEARVREALTDQFRALLPERESRHYVVATLRGTRLVVHANSASWATRLRFRAPELLRRLRRLQDFAAVDEMRIRMATRRTIAPDDG